MATGDTIAVESAAFDAASAFCGRARRLAFALPERILAGAHDTHAAALDDELDAFAVHGQAAAAALITRIAVTEGLLDLASHGFSAVELRLAAALAP